MIHFAAAMPSRQCEGLAAHLTCHTLPVCIASRLWVVTTLTDYYNASTNGHDLHMPAGFGWTKSGPAKAGSCLQYIMVFVLAW